MLTVIIPTFNEIKSNYLEKILNDLSLFNLEIIIVDSFSTDGTIELVKKHNVKLIQIQTTSRAKRYNAGIENSSGDLILLHHPRSHIETEGIRFLMKPQQNLDWGAFTHKFDKDNFLLSFTSWYSNFIRGDLRSIYYLDHCIFVKKELLKKVGCFDEVDIFEDTILCRKLKLLSKPIRSHFISTTSAIRFTKNGFIKQIYLNQKMKLLYFLKKDHKKLNKEYDNLELNSEYERD